MLFETDQFHQITRIGQFRNSNSESLKRRKVISSITQVIDIMPNLTDVILIK